jgi:hypothetical protein
MLRATAQALVAASACALTAGVAVYALLAYGSRRGVDYYYGS